MLRKIWGRLATSLQGVDKRQFQHEIDTHRLFLLTSYKKLDSPTEENVADVEGRADRTGFEEWKQEVQGNVGEQVRVICSALDNILLDPSERSKAKDGEAGKKNRPSGLSFAVGGWQPAKRETEPAQIVTLPLNRAQVSEAFKEKLGFTLELNPSRIAHREAGDGLYVSGKAGAGSVVSMYPGVIYAPAQYRYLQGYPRVELGNPYLVSRFDGLVIDGNPWGRGGDTREFWDGMSKRDREVQEHILKSIANEQPQEESSQGEAKSASDKLWQMVGGGRKGDELMEGAVLERRNPLALAHFANHPPKGGQPNVMVCPYNLCLDGEGIKLRPYIPNVTCAVDSDIPMQQSGLLWVKRSRETSAEKKYKQLCTLVLVATRDVCDEELLLNYRYSNFKNRPAWYHSVDEEEDRRRWE